MRGPESITDCARPVDFLRGRPGLAPPRFYFTFCGMSDSLRTRTFSWQDPLVGAHAARALSGLDYLRAMTRGELPYPPITATLGFDQLPPEIEPGRVTFFLEPQEYHYNPIGSVHGGVFATLLDSAMGCAVLSRLAMGTGYTTLELSVNFVRPLKAGSGLVRCEGQVLSMGRRVATAEGRIVDAAGKLYAHATTTCLLLTGPKQDPA